ncbi:Bromodomain-containing protein [Dioscorea alata]|uniref:Bromodomain-containing protein n=1 Tax=Dioscorea alata TaxID=55571 RepID=A0ACB7VCM6_DIOAL|nr:Bromodomain-containing protein [Dioscorea alata]
MASALLASRNEPYWGEAKVYMRKNPNPNPNPSIHNHYNNPGFLLDGGHENHHQIRQMEPDEIAAGAASVSDDSSSLSRRPAGPGRNRDSSVGHITFNLASYSRRELRELKRRLVSELERVRSVASRIDASTRSGGYQPREPISGSDSKKAKKPAPGSEAEKLLSGMMKKCGQILSKLMKHKGAIWFNTPVDVVGMGLHDYHQIIKNPMDLGTVKTKLNKGMYQVPPEFAADIKLTFDNALLYNPEGHEVHRVASQLLKIFEGLYYPAYEKYEKQWNAICRVEEEEELKRGIGNSWSPVPDYTRRAEPITSAAPPPPNPTPIAPAYGKQLQQPPPQQQQQQQQQMSGMGRVSTVKQPKPKAKDPNKRAMTLDEKQKLSLGLQSLPDEKMEHVIQIVRRRNGDPMQHGDEILLDFETMDNETLWELDRFVGNCKKMMSKMRRLEALAGANATAAGGASTAPASAHADDGDKSPTAAKKSKKGETGDEDVDIGDEMPSLHYPSVEIEKDTGNASSSSSSGSDSSSSSSDSDSGSSSDSDSGGGEDEAQSPGGAAPDSRPSLP